MMENIELRDYLAGQIISANPLRTFHTGAMRKNIAPKDEKEEWIQQTAEQATNDLMRERIRLAYRVADVMIEERTLVEFHNFTVSKKHLNVVLETLNNILKILNGEDTETNYGDMLYEKLTIREIITELQK